MPKSRKPLASPIHPQPFQHLIDANHREVERRIAAIIAIRDAETQGLLSQLRVAESMLSPEILAMPLSHFLNKFCPDREAVMTDSGSIELRRKNVGADCAISFEFQREQPPFLQPTPMVFPFSMPSAKDQLLRSVERLPDSEIEDEQFLKMIHSFKESKALHPGVVTPSMDGHLVVGITPRTERLPRKGEPLLSVNGSPLGHFGKEGITSIPEEHSRNVRRRLRASSTYEHL